MYRKNGFSLVELLIIIAILGLMAAIVMPKLSDARHYNKISALNDELRKMRAQIELYKFQHDGALPAFKGEASTDFWRRMTTGTDIKGSAGSDFGPYSNTHLNNPINGKTSVRIDGPAAGANTDGWRFNSSTGTFQADDSVENSML
jgi:prepilin-type N-terminal cleavage/methylation domain-containing protein